MADVSLTHHDCVDDSDEGFEQGDCQMGISDADADDVTLPLLLRVQKYSRSVRIGYRQMVASFIIELLRTTPADILEKNLPDIIKELTRAGEESILRADLLDRIPQIAKQLLICSDKVSNARSVISDQLIPFVVRNLGSTDTVIDRTAQTTLVQLVENEYISKFQVEIQVCPSILALSKAEMNADINAHTGAITLMSRLAQYLGRDVVERVFLKRFTELCASTIFYVRRLCAANIGEFSNVVGKEAFENQLFPCYLTLCTDEIWGVRKACAEVVMYVSCCCTQQCRNEQLAPVFVKLLQDDCRWVKAAAYQSLGFFISTFADPTETNIAYSSNGDLVLTNKDGEEFEMNCSTRMLTIHDKIDTRGALASKETFDREYKLYEENDECLWELGSANWESTNSDPLELSSTYTKLINTFNEIQCKNDENVENGNTDAVENLVNESNSNVVKENISAPSNSIRDVNDNEKVNTIGDTLEDDLHLFNSHIYWYISPPDLPLDPSIIAGQDHNVTDETISLPTPCTDNIEVSTDNVSSTFSLDDPNSTITLDDTKSLEKGDNEEKQESSEETPETEEPVPEQDVIPQPLVDHFVSMTDSALSMIIDNELTYHCAYSLPAVALTLGSENWYLLKNTVDLLASDMQYKVRKTVAKCLHELAMILGPELATESLTPLFEGFIKDLDEVRIGVLKHLSEFLPLIEPTKRASYLPRLAEFLRTDTEWNWRFRHELASQLLYCIPLFKPADTAKHIGMIAISLLSDKVAAVREIALTLITEILSYISTEQGLTPNLLVKLVEHFAHSKKWKRRQTFCLLCTELLREETLPPEQFASELLPHLLDLSWDPVANIRLVVARCLARHLITNSYFSNPNNEHYEGLETVLRRLQADKDRDVRQSAEDD